MQVEFVRWPVEQERRKVLEGLGRPRLLLVDSGDAPPSTPDVLEDWIRLPAEEIDIRARAESLLEASLSADLPELDDDGLLRFRGRWAAMPPIEANLVRALIDAYGTVVTREQLSVAGWPDGSPGRNALDVHMLRLRRRIDGLDLAIRTVRSRGYVLETVGSGAIRSAFVKQSDQVT